MSNTAAESVAASQPTVPETNQSKKFDNVHKSVASKAKSFLHIFHSAGENIRGNVNAALDGAGDAIAGRKSGEISGRKSGEQTRSLAQSKVVAPAAAPAATPAAIETQSPTPADNPATTSSNEPAPQINVTDETARVGDADKKYAVGQFINQRFKRTVDLVTRVGTMVRSKSVRTAETLGSNLADKKQRASRRFSRNPKPDPTNQEANPDASSPVPVEIPLPETPAVNTEPAATQ